MKKGNLVIYDKTGKIFSQTGEAEGDVLPHVYPEGIPYIEIPFGTMATKKLISIDVSVIPHQPIFEEIEIKMSDADRIAELEDQLLIQAEDTIGGLL
ncbi:hypothetical protein [Fusibacter ferrireducens]|uniref:Phage protein n=1 Tax=Fusibacter ferrireducens TaxID=2785058 RepID=A0ABR9ZU70_9FIRM|nr:hypothetical protein [Fusibacter ferrireducens]MBF4693891.1 hypothetical protein [Fusibacter ferrireducens]